MALYIKKGITMKFPQASIKKIVLLTDFTDASTDASYHAMLQAQTYKAELKALYVYKPRALGISDENYLSPERFISNEDPKKTRQRGEDTLKELAESFDLEVETIFSEGSPGQETIRITSQLDTNLIVLGTQSYTRWNRFLGIPGSVAEYIVKYAPCAVSSIGQGSLGKANFPNETEYRVHDERNADAKIH